jgi:hypothetical protein
MWLGIGLTESIFPQYIITAYIWEPFKKHYGRRIEVRLQ